MPLGPLQADLLERATDLTAGGRDFQNLLFVGPKGCGKQTIARELAASFGMEFVPVPMDGTADDIRDRLFGTPTEAARATDGGSLPGLFGASQPTLVYLERFHAVPPELFSPMQQVISQRRCFAADGASNYVSNDLVVVAGLRDREPDASVTPSIISVPRSVLWWMLLFPLTRRNSLASPKTYSIPWTLGGRWPRMSAPCWASSSKGEIISTLSADCYGCRWGTFGGQHPLMQLLSSLPGTRMSSPTLAGLSIAGEPPHLQTSVNGKHSFRLLYTPSRSTSSDSSPTDITYRRGSIGSYWIA